MTPPIRRSLTFCLVLGMLSLVLLSMASGVLVASDTGDVQEPSELMAAGPDLRMTQYYLRETDGTSIYHATSGRPLYAFGVVTNEGDTGAGAFKVFCWLDSVPYCYWEITGLAAGASITVQTPEFALSEASMHTITFRADYDSEVFESDETNNQMAWALYVDPADWTVLIYMDGDNNLEFDMLYDFMRMTGVGSSRSVSVVVQMDRSPSYDTSYGDWDQCLRFYVESPMLAYESDALMDLGEVNMGDGATLEDFLVWGAQTYVADHYLVVLKDHGGSWVGCCQDMTSGGDILSLPEISHAFRAMVNETGSSIDLVLFDDCLMGSLEVVTEMNGTVDYMVASETSGWTSNIDYDELLLNLKADTSISTEELAISIAENMNLVDNNTLTTQCVAAYDLTKADALIAGLNDYLDDLYTSWIEDPSYLQWSRGYSSSLDVAWGQDTVDLYQFISNTMMLCNNPDLNITGQAVLDMFNTSSADPFVLTCLTTPTAAFCNGLSAYFPLWLDDFNANYMSCGAICYMSEWPSMVETYLTDGPPLTLLNEGGTLGNDGWYVSEVLVNFLYYDPTDMGIEYLNYSFGVGWSAFTGPFTMSEDGMYTIYWYSTGANGAEENIRNGTIWIDRTKPTVQTTVDGYDLTLNASDAMSGVSTVHYRIDGGAWYEYSGQFTVGAVGWQYAVEYYATDVAGNDGTVQTVLVGDDDDVAPEVSIALDGPMTEGWYTAPVTVTLSASDTGGSGLDAIYYRLDGGSWVTYTSPFQVSASGTHTLEFYAEDNFGNQDSDSRVLKVDVSAPESSYELDGVPINGWFNGPVGLELNATDEDSGVAKIWYRLKGGDWTLYTDMLNITSEGTTLVEWYSVDTAGNEEGVQELEVSIDTTAPAVVIEATGLNAAGWGNASASYVLNASDEGSGVMVVMYRVDGGNWSEYAGAIGFNATGSYLVECYVVDNANNSGSVSNFTCHADTTAPISETSVSGLLDGGAYLNLTNVTMSATDAHSGVAATFVSTDNATWTEYNGTISFTEGTYTMWYYTTDEVGNAEAVRSVSFTVIEATVPDQVDGLEVEVTEGIALLSWEAPEDGGTDVISYQVYRSLNGEEAELIATVIATEYEDDGLVEGDSATYYVIAENLLGEGEQSSSVIAEIPNPSDNTMLFVAIGAIVAIAAIGAVLFLRKKR